MSTAPISGERALWAAVVINALRDCAIEGDFSWLNSEAADDLLPLVGLDPATVMRHVHSKPPTVKQFTTTVR